MAATPLAEWLNGVREWLDAATSGGREATDGQAASSDSEPLTDEQRSLAAISLILSAIERRERALREMGEDVPLRSSISTLALEALTDRALAMEDVDLVDLRNVSIDLTELLPQEAGGAAGPAPAAPGVAATDMHGDTLMIGGVQRTPYTPVVLDL
jgi:hypothetical protein